MMRFVYSYVLFLLLASASESDAQVDTACTPSISRDGTQYRCQRRGYTQVPKTVWIATTTYISLRGNEISFIPVNAFDGLTLMTYLSLASNTISLIPVGMVVTNTALGVLDLNINAITFIPVGMLDNNPALTILGLHSNAIPSIPVGMLDTNTALELLDLSYNAITSVPVGMFNNNPALEKLVLGGNPLVCSNFSPENTDEDDYYSGSWVQGTALSTICTSCTDGTPETITIDTVDFWQCSTCILKNDAPSSTEVNDAMEVFCPDYAINVGVKGKPEYGGSAKMCKEKDQKYETRLHKAMFHGMFGGASSSGRDCGAWCLFDVEEQNRHFRWDNRNTCWKTKKNRPCTGSTNIERVFAADISDSFC